MSNMEDYGATRGDFRLDVPDRFNFTIDTVDRWARDDPDKLALVAVHPDGLTTTRHAFGEMSRDANRVANYLKGLGVGKGDRIFVQLPRVPEWYSTVLGSLKLGAVPMPGTSLLMARDIAYRVNAAEATVIVTDPAGAARADEVADYPCRAGGLLGADTCGAQAGSGQGASGGVAGACTHPSLKAGSSSHA